MSDNKKSLLDEILDNVEETYEEDIKDSESKNLELEELSNEKKKESELEEKENKKKKKQKKPITFFGFLKLTGTLLVVLLIAASGFLTYMALNPEQAVFFKQFGILPSDIAILLGILVNFSFGVIITILSVIWMYLLFRAIITKRVFKRKKTLAIILAITVGIILFSAITLWAYLIAIIKASDYANPNGGVVLYDNSRLNSKIFDEESSKIFSTSNIFTPLEVKFDIKPEARLAERDIYIDGFEIDYNGDGSTDYIGKNPFSESNLIFNYIGTGLINPKGSFKGRDKITLQEREVEIQFSAINLAGEVIVKEFEERTGGVRVFFDASSIASFGNIFWFRQETLNKTGFDVPDGEGATFTANNYIFKNEEGICMSIINNKDSSHNCDKVFIVGKQESNNKINFNINYVQSPQDFKFFKFSVSDIEGEEIGVQEYEWSFDGSNKSYGDSIEHSFREAGSKIVSLKITDIVGNESIISKEINVVEPLYLKESDRIKINVNSIESNYTFDEDTKIYSVEDIEIPSKAILDASEVEVTSRFWELEKVEWDTDNDGKYNLIEEQHNLDINKEEIYIIPVKMSFKSLFKNIDGEIERKYIEQKIILNAMKSEFRVILNTKQDSDYIPVFIEFDASASEYKNGEITEYTFDFGTGETEKGDSIIKYRYTKAGEYNIKVTAKTEDGKEKTLTKKLIFKNEPSRAEIGLSTSEGRIGRAIDFKSTGSTGQIQSYYWKFGDGITSREANPKHIYNSVGEYKVILSITLDGGIVLEDSKKIYIGE